MTCVAIPPQCGGGTCMHCRLRSAHDHCERLRAALVRHVEVYGGSDHHADDCETPETCLQCRADAAVNAVLGQGVEDVSVPPTNESAHACEVPGCAPTWQKACSKHRTEMQIAGLETANRQAHQAIARLRKQLDAARADERAKVEREIASNMRETAQLIRGMGGEDFVAHCFEIRAEAVERGAYRKEKS